MEGSKSFLRHQNRTAAWSSSSRGRSLGKDTECWREACPLAFYAAVFRPAKGQSSHVSLVNE